MIDSVLDRLTDAAISASCAWGKLSAWLAAALWLACVALVLVAALDGCGAQSAPPAPMPIKPRRLP
jgi:hypothetical protein